MSNCTVNNCKYAQNSWTPVFPAPSTTASQDQCAPGSSNPMCINDLSNFGTNASTTRANVVKECNGKSSCFSTLNAIDKEPRKLFDDLMTDGWGDKDKDTSVLGKINKAAPENLRDQLKFELCRRASCIPEPRDGNQTAWDWWSTFAGYSWYTIALYALAAIPLIWIVCSILLRPFIDDDNNIPAVLTGAGNSKKSMASSGLYIVATIIVITLCSMIFGKYSLTMSFSIVACLFAVFMPSLSPKQNASLFILSLVAKGVAVYFTIKYLLRDHSDWTKSNKIQGAETSGIMNGVFYIIVALLIGYYSLKSDPWDKLGAFTTLALLGVGITVIILGSKNVDKMIDVNSQNVISQLIANSVLVSILAICSFLPFGNNSLPTIGVSVSALMLFNLLDTTNILDAVNPENSLNGITIVTAIIMAVAVPLYIKNNGAFRDISYASTAGSFFNTYTAMSGIQTFLGAFMPPLTLTLLVLERVLGALFRKAQGKTDSVNTWTFLMSGTYFSKLFNSTMENMSYPDRTKLFNEDKAVGAKNVDVFIY